MMNLPIVQPITCDGCGECCRHIGTPPGYALFFPPAGQRIMAWTIGTPDHERFKRMPATIKRKLREYYQRMWRKETPDRTGFDMPCLWFDEATKRCRHYEWRPDICREFEVGGEGCLEWRSSAGITNQEASNGR